MHQSLEMLLTDLRYWYDHLPRIEEMANAVIEAHTPFYAHGTPLTFEGAVEEVVVLMLLAARILRDQGTGDTQIQPQLKAICKFAIKMEKGFVNKSVQ